jgi:transketolase
MRDTFLKTLCDLAETDDRVVLLTGDLGFKVLDDFARRFPDRYFNVGVAEANLVTISAALAADGYRPFAYSIGNFPTLRCLEQIRMNIAYTELPVTIVSVGAGFAYGSLGISHHATDDIASMRALHTVRVVSPSDLQEVAEYTEMLLTETQPAYLRLDKDVAPDRKDVACAPDGWRVLDVGSDVALLAHGGIRREAEAAALLLRNEGVSVAVVSAPVLSLFDQKQVESCISNQRLLVSVEEHSVNGGLGSILAEAIADSGSCQKLVRMGLRRFSHEVGSQEYLRRVHRLSATHIANEVRQGLDSL